jgi:hypothetical protein
LAIKSDGMPSSSPETFGSPNGLIHLARMQSFLIDVFFALKTDESDQMT